MWVNDPFRLVVCVGKLYGGCDFKIECFMPGWFAVVFSGFGVFRVWDFRFYVFGLNLLGSSDFRVVGFGLLGLSGFRLVWWVWFALGG